MTDSKRSRSKGALNSLLSSKSDHPDSKEPSFSSEHLGKNVTSITPESSDDPFNEVTKKTSLDTADDPILLDHSDETVLVQDSILNERSSVENIDAKPQKIKPKKSNKRASTNKGGRVSGVAISLSIIALLGSGYSIFSQDAIQQTLKESLGSLESSLYELADRSDLLESSLSSTAQTVSTNSDEIVELQTMRTDLLSINQAIDSIRQEANQVGKSIETQKQTLDEHGDLIKGLKSDVKALEKRPKPVVRKVVNTPKAKPKKPVENSNSIQGATVSTIDQWGASSYVMLRDKEGNWIPLQRGDSYKGWRFIGSTGDKALFRNGAKSKKLEVEL